MKKCPFCAEDIQDAAIVCKHCKRDLPPAEVASAPQPTPPPSERPKRRLFFISLGVGLLVLVWIAAFYRGGQGVSVRSSTAISSLEDRGRDLYEARLPEVMQRNERCEITRTFYSGWRADGQEFFWSVECKDGRKFLLRVNGKTGATTTLDCAVARAVNVNCFEKFK